MGALTCAELKAAGFRTIDEAPQRCENTAPMEPASDDPRTRLLYDLAREFGAQLELDKLLPLIIGKCLKVLTALARTGGKMAEAARLLGISRVALHKRIKQQNPR